MARRPDPAEKLLQWVISIPIFAIWLFAVALWKVVFKLLTLLARVTRIPGFWRLLAKAAAPIGTLLLLAWLNVPELLALIIAASVGLASFFPNQILSMFWKIRAISESWRSEVGTTPSSKASDHSEERQDFTDRPAPRVELSPREAEKLVQEWLVKLGFPEARVTQYSQDGGVDVLTDEFAVQVKRWRKGNNLGVRDVRELFGVATKLGKRPIFFTTSSASSAAMAEADELSIPIIQFDYLNASLSPLNPAGRKFLAIHRVGPNKEK